MRLVPNLIRHNGDYLSLFNKMFVFVMAPVVLVHNLLSLLEHKLVESYCENCSNQWEEGVDPHILEVFDVLVDPHGQAGANSDGRVQDCTGLGHGVTVEH